MATINRNGTAGTNGTSGASPTAGTNGGAAIYTQNGTIGADSTTVNAIGGNGGAGGNGTGVAGANGGDGGNASITFNGNIFNSPASTTVLLSLNSTGGNGGLGGTGTSSGTTGRGGNATVTASGNIFQPNKALTSIELDAFATGGSGSTWGNATSTINGNIFQSSRAVGTVTLDANASGSGTNNATINGNIVQGNINNVNLFADAPNGTATINGNIVQTNASNTGTVTLEASGSHIAITQNKFTLGLQALDFTINPYSPYDTIITGNTLTGTGTNTFVFTDNAHPGPNPDTINIDMSGNTMVFDGEASNAFTGFNNVTLAGTDITGTLIGNTGNNGLTGSGGNDTFTGGQGNDNINGGAGTDTAIYTGTFAQYTVAVNNTGNGTVTDNTAGRDGTDTLTSIEFLRFSDGTFNTATQIFTPNAPANHAPTAVNDPGYATNEDNALAVNAANGVLANDSDPDLGDTITASVVTGPSHAASFTLNADGSFNYTPTANFNGTDTFTYKATDNHGAQSNTATATITVNSVNDAPSGADKTVTTPEDTAYIFSASDFGFTDPNDSPANTLLAVKIDTLPAAGTLTDNGNPVTVGQFVPVADITGGNLRFTPALNANGAGYANFNFQVQDNGGTANGGVDLDPNQHTITVNVTAVNDAPVLDASKSPVLNSELQNAGAPVGAVGTLVSALVDLNPPAGGLDNVTDPDGTGLGIALTGTDTVNGSWFYSTNNGTNWTAVGAVSDAGALLLAADANTRLYFQPNAGYSGTDNSAITFRAWDQTSGSNGGTANVTTNGGATAFSAANDTAALTVTPNSAPVLDNTKTPVLATEGENPGAPGVGSGTLISSLVDLNPPAGGLDNVTDSDPGAVTGIALTAADTTNGSWLYSTDGGTTWNAVGPVSNSSALLLSADANTRLFFQPNTNYSGTDSPAITFRAWDRTSGSNGGTADTTVNGGTTAFSAATDTANITVDPVRIGNTYYTTINQALAAAVNGDTIVVSPGTYNESLVINKQVTILGDGPAGSVIIKGTFAQDNGIPVGTDVATWLKTAPGYTGDTGVTINADNVTLNNLTVENFQTDIGGLNNAERTAAMTNTLNNLSLTNVTMQDTVTGFLKDDGTTLNNLNMQGGGVNDSLFGIYFANDVPTPDDPINHTGDAVNTTINGASFSNIDEKGIYAETMQGNSSLDNITMNDVGNYGGVPANGANHANGNGIDLNLKFHTYVGNLDLTNNNLTNTGNSPNGQNGAVVVEGRDDPGHPVYGPNPADVSGLNVTITGGTIDGSPSGVRVGELNKVDPAHNVTGPAITIDGTVITNTPNGQVENHSNSLMTVIGTNGDDTYASDQTAVSTGPIFFQGLGGNDTLTGGTGDDTLQGGTGDDTLDGGTGGVDTADYTDATQNGLVVNLLDGTSSGGGDGNDTLFNIQNINGSSFNDTLVGDGNDNLLAGGDGNDILYGHGGNDILVGGNGTDVAYYSGLETDYNPGVSLTSVSGGPESANDFLIAIERLKFLSPSHVSDIDNNGTGDLVFQDGSGNISANGSTLTTTIPTTSRVVGTGTFNPDDINSLGTARNADILVQASNGTLSVLYDINGTSSSGPVAFSDNPAGSVLTAGNYNSNWKAIATGDFNGDASADVLLQNTSTKAVEIFTVKANSTDAIGQVDNVSTVTAPAGTGWNPIASGDFNGDGKSDILWQNSLSKAVEIYEISDTSGPTATLLNTPTPKSASGLTAIGTGDFNGDGTSDILFQNAAGQAVIWFMYGDTHTGTKTIANPGGTYHVAGAEDVDGNGYSDILWTDNSNNVLATEFTSPSSLVSSTVVVGSPFTQAAPGGTFKLIASTGGG